jgi:hypothetical protein
MTQRPGHLLFVRGHCLNRVNASCCRTWLFSKWGLDPYTVTVNSLLGLSSRPSGIMFLLSQILETYAMLRWNGLKRVPSSCVELGLHISKADTTVDRLTNSAL